MASSEVEIVPSSPFGSVLKDRNSRDRCRESNARAATFQKNLKELVKDQFQNCISVSADENYQKQQQAHGVGKEQGNGNNSTNNGHDRNLRFLSNNHYKSNGNKSNNDDSSIISSRKSQNLDKWAAKQAREMLLTIEKQSQEAELLAGSSLSASSERENSQNSPTESKNSTAVGNLGASSLVQIWEARLTRSYSMNNNNKPVSSSSRTSSGCSSNDNVEESSRESEMTDSVDEGYDTRPNDNEDSFADWESHSDRTSHSEPPTFSNPDAGERERERERERVRIADIIKKLANGSDDNYHEMGTNGSDSPSREHRNLPVMDQAEQREQRYFSRVKCPPKIRGRQAFSDLLMQLERDRHRELDSLVERQAVSKFPQRGRIQSMLRLRFLHRGKAIQDQRHPKSAESPLNRLSRGTITHLREKFSTGVDHGVTARNDASTSKNSHTEMANNTIHLQNSSTASQLSKDSEHQEVTTAGRNSTGPTENSVPQINEDHQKLSCPRIDVTQLEPQISEDHQDVTTAGRKNTVPTENSVPQISEDHQKLSGPRTRDTQQEPQISEDHNKISILRTGVARQEPRMEGSFLDPQGTAESTTLLNGRRSEMAQDQETNHQLHVHGNLKKISESTGSLDAQNENEMINKQEPNDQQPFYLDSQEIGETSASLNDWYENELEEENYDQDNFVETNYDWISGISRPRSYWEDRRQMWYQEMLSNSSNEEIRQLLERRRVSSFLTSDFRETMDQLMTSHVQRQTELEGYQNEEEEINQERIGELLLSHLQGHMHPAINQEEEQAEGDQVEQVVEEEEEQEQREGDCEEGNEQEEGEDEEEEEQSQISHQLNEASDFFYQSSASTQMTSPWRYQDHEVVDDSDPVASVSSPQPLQSQAGYQDSRESASSTHRFSIETELIYDLRGQIEQLHREMSELRKSVQSCMDMQVKFNQSNQQEVLPVQGMGNNSVDWATKKRKCCICYEMQVDTLLYRCGHMCTCLKCAHELQWNSGKCPICRAPILDVVRAFMDS